MERRFLKEKNRKFSERKALSIKQDARYEQWGINKDTRLACKAIKGILVTSRKLP